MSDNVNHPTYYSPDKIECIEAIEVVVEKMTGIEAFCTGTALKYLWRWKAKNGHEDLRKARWYINYLLGETDKQLAQTSSVVDAALAPVVCAKCKKPYQSFMLNNDGWCQSCSGTQG